MQEMEKVFGVVADYFAVLSGPTRLKILHALCDGELTVGRIVETTGSNQANISQQLSLMFRAGVLARRKEGNQVYYWVSDPKVVEICRFVCVLVASRMDEREVAPDALGTFMATGAGKRARKARQ